MRKFVAVPVVLAAVGIAACGGATHQTAAVHHQKNGGCPSGTFPSTFRNVNGAACLTRAQVQKQIQQVF